MLSAHKIGAEHVTYYLSYVERGGDPGRWMGAGAEALGLGGTVEAEAFANLAAGFGPDGSKLIERVHANRVMGWDLTLSAPKSLSLLAALHPEETQRSALRDVHDRAVQAALSYLEDVGGAARRGDGGKDGHVAAKLVIAGFVHKTSRESEPDLHEHGIVLNVGLGEDDRWTAVDSRWLFARKAGAEAVYRSELYAGAAALGVTWTAPDGHGNREIEGFERAELRAWSTRRVNIEQELARNGGAGRRAAEGAALATRKTKVDVEFATLTKEWRRRATSEGLGPRRLGKIANGRDRSAMLSQAEIVEARDKMLGLYGLPGTLFGTGSAFTADEVSRAWVDQLPAGAHRAELDQLVTDTLADPRVVPLVVADHEGQVLSVDRHLAHNAKAVRLVRRDDLVASRCQVRYTTQAMLALEGSVIDAVGRGRGISRAVVNSDLVEAVLALHPSLTADQVAMVRAVTTSGNGVEAVVGPPGAGKSFAFGVAREIWLAAGLRVQGGAPTGKAAVNLIKGASIDSTTLADLNSPATPTRLVRGGVFVLDEASMTATTDMAILLHAAEAEGTKVIVVGDPHQIQSVSAGGTFTAIVERFGASELVENGRQAQAWERDALDALREGRSGEAVASYVARGRLVVADDGEDLMKACVGDWWAARADGEAAIYAATREQVFRLNSLARAFMAGGGRLSGPELVVGSFQARGYALPERTFAAGDEVLLCKNRAKVAGDVPITLPDGSKRHQGVKNGQVATVVAIGNKGRLSVAMTDGRHLDLPKYYVDRYLAHGYAITAHKSQGDTVGEAARTAALGIIEEADRRKGRAFVLGLSDAELGLVMASRATDETRFYVQSSTELDTYDEGVHTDPVDPAAALAKAWGRSGAEVMGLDELERQRAVRRLAAGCSRDELATRRQELHSVGRGDEDPAIAAHAARQEIEAASIQVENARRALADAILEVDDAHEKAAGAATVGEANKAPSPAPLAVLLIEAEARAEAALMRSRVADRRLAQIRADHLRSSSDQPSDRWSLAKELTIVDDALATQRRWSIDALVADPPTWATAVLGPRPEQAPRSLRWRQGLALLSDARETRDYRAAGNGLEDLLVGALGERPQDTFASAAWSRNADAVARVRVDLGLEVPDEAAVGDSSGRSSLDDLIRASRQRAADHATRSTAGVAPAVPTTPGSGMSPHDLIESSRLRSSRRSILEPDDDSSLSPRDSHEPAGPDRGL